MNEEESDLGDILVDIDDDRWLTWRSPDEWSVLLREIINEVTKAASIGQNAEVSVVLADDAEVQKLNKRYLKKDKPTNVLSFPSLTPDEIERAKNLESPYPLMLGDIALAFETIEAEAKTENKTFLRHFSHLVVHGMLHLLGYDHETDADAERMQAKEIAILKELNIENPYL